MLRLILGRSGFGKTHFMQNKALELAENDEEVILIVPDQMSFETEKEMIYAKNEVIAAKVQVFHFGRLCEDIFRLFGGISENRIDDSGRRLIMAMAVSACKPQLEVYGKINENELCSLMLSTVEEFKNSGISVELLRDLQRNFKGDLGKKLAEICDIYASYEGVLEDKYIENLDLESRAAKVVEKTDYFKNKTVLLDGFEGFDSKKMSLLKVVLRDAKEVFISFCTDDIYNQETNSFFLPIAESARKIMALAKEVGRKVAVPLNLENATRFENNELKFLEENFFRSKKPSEKMPCENIEIFEASDLYQEVDFVCAKIKELVQNGYNYGDISVVTANESKFTHALQNSFSSWEIPAFLSLPMAVDSSPLIRMVFTVFSILEYGFNTSDILTLAKTGLCEMDTKEISELENYVYMWRIDGREWLSPFTKSASGLKNSENKAHEKIEYYRKKLVEPILYFKEKCKDSSANEISKALYYLLIFYKSDECIVKNCKIFEMINMPDEAEKQKKIWEQLMDVLDKFAKILGDTKISAIKYGRLLRDVLSKEELMDIPRRLDTVTFTTASSVKISTKIVFLIGCAQGEFPLIPSQNGIFSLAERNTLAKGEIPFENNMEKDLLLERFYAYNAVCRGSEKLFASYHISDGKNEHVKSEIIRSLQDVFKLEIIRDLPVEFFIGTSETLFSSCAKNYNKNNITSKTLAELVSFDPNLSGRFNALKRTANKENFSLESEIAKEVFENKTYSPSQIETYHQCKFQYFCKYALGARVRKSAEVDVLEYGTLMHYLFEKILNDFDYKNADEESLKAKIESLINEYIKENMGGIEAFSAFDKYRFERMKDTALVLTLRLIEELKQSEFKAEYFELNLKENAGFLPLKIKTEKGDEAEVSGIIDRVDIYQDNGVKYARVVDYKTGKKKFKYGDVLNGLNLQMLVYLAVLKEANLLPAGALYMPSAYPSVSAKKGDTLAAIEKSKYKLMQLKGVVLDDKEIVKAMEEKIAGKYLPFTLLKNENLRKSEYLLRKSEFENLFEYAKKLITSMVENLLNGNIEAVPLTKGINPCSWCDYRAICGVEDVEKEDFSMKKDDFFKNIKPKEEEQDENLD